MLSESDMSQNPKLRGGQTLLWLPGLPPEPLPSDPRTAIENFLIKGHTNYIPKGATKVLNAFDHPEPTRGSVLMRFDYTQLHPQKLAAQRSNAWSYVSHIERDLLHCVRELAL